MRARADFVHVSDGRNGSASHVVGVLQGDEAGLCDVIRWRRNLRSEQLPGENSARGGDWAHHAAAKPSRHCHLIVEDVAALLAENFLAGTGVQLDCDLVAHGSRRNEDCGFSAKDLGGSGFQPVYSGSSP